MDKMTDGSEAATAGAAAPASRGMSETEIRYMRGPKEPATSSVLISNSKYLNNPLYRDVWAQFSLRRVGDDLSETYLIPDMIRALGEVTDMAEFARLVEEEKAANPAFAAWLKERRLTSYRPDDLKGYAPGTLGAAIREFISASGMEIEFMMKGESPRSDLEYLMKRRTASHDIEHMVFGFPPYHAGEIALAACNLTAASRFFSPKLAAYIYSQVAFVTMAGLYRSSLHYPEVVSTLMEALRLGTTAGAALEVPPWMVNWEDYLDWPMEDIARDLGIERGPGEAWKWTAEAAKG
jgi:ubiquinone biosynthesis protein Coq4